MTPDPLDPSPEYLATMDQLTAATREFSARLRGMVTDLIEDGWTDQQARELVVAVIVKGSRS